MPHEWVPIEAGTDLPSMARVLRQVYGSDPAPSDVHERTRTVVAASWERSRRHGVHRHGLAPVMLSHADARHLFKSHPLHVVAQVVAHIAARVAELAPQVVALANADGLIMWTKGNARAVQAAREIRFVPGAMWAEEVVGTNALGTALLVDHPLMIFASEHFKRSLHAWSSSCAPIHDPETGTLLGAVVLFGPYQTAHPHGFSLAVIAAEMAEERLRHIATERDDRLRVEYLATALHLRPEASAVVNPSGFVLLCDPPHWLGRRIRLGPDGSPLPAVSKDVTIQPLEGGAGYLILSGVQETQGSKPSLSLRALGIEQAVGHLDGVEFQFTRRHSEILVAMALHPKGLSEDMLAEAVYGSSLKRMTLRAEISRLRRILGPVVMTRPYRLTANVHADFLEALDLIDRGEFAAAAKQFRGSVMPSSAAPAVVDLRQSIDAAIGRGGGPAGD